MLLLLKILKNIYYIKIILIPPDSDFNMRTKRSLSVNLIGSYLSQELILYTYKHKCAIKP